MKTKMYEYKVFRIKNFSNNTQNMLNELGSQGWKLVCSYALCNEWLIMEREVK